MNDRRYKRGYNINQLQHHVRAKLKAFEKTSLPAALTEAVLTIASIPAVVTIFAWSLWRLYGLGVDWILMYWAVAGYALTAIIIARQQRGLELMVHDASHRTWYSRSLNVNNFAANLFVGFPVLTRVERYWQSHRVHHGTYGTHQDPCRRRFQKMGISNIDLSTRWNVIRAVLRWLPQYNMTYYREIGGLSLSQWISFWTWHSVVFIAPISIGCWAGGVVGGGVSAIALAFVIWIAFWMIPAIAILPVLRSIAETEEHDYDLGETEFETTFTNIGWLHKALIHPKNDSYHLVHHMFPSIPERVHHKVHRLLMQYDPQYRSALHRTDVLQKVGQLKNVG
jgi:fatty acid desaturase